MAFKALKARKFKFRLQIRPPSQSGKPRRVSLVAQRRIVKNGKIITAGAVVQGPGSLNVAISKPEVKQIGIKAKPGGVAGVGKLKVGGKWKRTVQANG